MNSKIMFDIIKNRKKLFFLSGIITIVGIITLTIFGLNTGVDFKAGTTLDIIIGKKVDRMHVEQLIKDTIGFKDSTTTVGGTNSDRATVRFDNIDL